MSIPVVSTMKDPLCGWINNIYGTVGAFVGFYLGLIKSGLIDGNKKQDFIPADLCINSLIAAAYDRATSCINYERSTVRMD
uniref:Fatty acyl-CoA reductase n=1 Tax=Timema tahoe TaxID=61484 RepID=A0A7R9IQ82_9NEOP|nr:unnamed protein product [Timema tahoe]